MPMKKNDRIFLANYKLIESFPIKEMYALAIYYKVKRMFRNSVVYNWSYKKTAEILGISYHKSRKYIKILKDKGLVKEHCGNLLFISHAKAISEFSGGKKKLAKRINIKHEDSIEDIKDKLIALSIDNDIIRQEYINNLRSDIAKLEDVVKHDSQKLGKIRRKNPELLEKGEEFNIINCRKFGRDWGISFSTASRILQRLEEKKMLNRSPIKKVVFEGVTSDCMEYISKYSRKNIGYHYVSNGILYRYIGTNTSTNKCLLYS